VARCGGVTMPAEGEATPKGRREETMLVGLTQILLDRKINKIHTIDSAGTNDGEDLKQQ
jgi:hypothetical protein